MIFFKEEMVGGRARITTDEERVRGLKRDNIVEIAKLSGCKNFVGVKQREVYSQCVR